MITTDISNSNPFIQTGLATASVQTLFDPVTIAETLGFNGAGCSPYTELSHYMNIVLAENSYTSDYKNDKSSFIFQIPPKGTNSLAMELFKDGVKIADLNDNTYGTFYDFGDLSNDFYTGYVIEWKLVLAAHGVGCYHVRATGTILGDSYTVDSVCYELMVYDDHVANGTVYLRWQQNGNILSSPFDFTGMEWEKYIRIPAFFGHDEPTEEIDEIQMTTRKFEQIQSEVIHEYTLETKMIPQWLSELLINDLALSEKIYVTDYNAYNHLQDVIDKQVRFSGYDQNTYFAKNRLAKFSFKFKDRKENNLKRLYF